MRLFSSMQKTFIFAATFFCYMQCYTKDLGENGEAYTSCCRCGLAALASADEKRFRQL